MAFRGQTFMQHPQATHSRTLTRALFLTAFVDFSINDLFSSLFRFEVCDLGIFYSFSEIIIIISVTDTNITAFRTECNQYPVRRVSRGGSAVSGESDRRQKALGKILPYRQERLLMLPGGWAIIKNNMLKMRG